MEKNEREARQGTKENSRDPWKPITLDGWYSSTQMPGDQRLPSWELWQEGHQTETVAGRGKLRVSGEEVRLGILTVD